MLIVELVLTILNFFYLYCEYASLCMSTSTKESIRFYSMPHISLAIFLTKIWKEFLDYRNIWKKNVELYTKGMELFETR